MLTLIQSMEDETLSVLPRNKAAVKGKGRQVAIKDEPQ